LAAFCLVLLVDGVTPRAAAAVGGAFGVGWFSAWLSWMTVIGVDAWVLLSVVCAAFYVPLGWGIRRVLPLAGAPLLIGAVWVAVEALRARFPLDGFPWARLASGVEPPWLVAGPLVLGGIPLTTFVLATVGAAVAVALRSATRRRTSAAIVAGCAVALILPPFLVPAPSEDARSEDRGLDVALIQGDVPGIGLDVLGRRRQVLDNHIRQTRLLAAAVAIGARPAPDLVVWPENASDIDPFRDDEAAAAIQEVVDTIDAPVLLGAVIQVPDDRTRVRNTAILWRPVTGPEEVYVKQRPVPFGEYVPFRSLIEDRVGRLDRVPRDFVPGDGTGVITIDGVRLGIVICFEVAADDIVRSTVRDGAQALLVLTNNATYAATDQPEQQFAVTRMRAVEHRRPVLVAATTGITAAVDADGSVRAELPQSEPGSLDVRVIPAEAGPSTPAGRWGSSVEIALTIVGVLACAIGVRAGRRRGIPASGENPVQDTRSPA
jgi:apolipoprotein N-acyltransferase